MAETIEPHLILRRETTDGIVLTLEVTRFGTFCLFLDRPDGQIGTAWQRDFGGDEQAATVEFRRLWAVLDATYKEDKHEL